MVTWSVELFEFDIRYKPRTAIKAQALADFLIEMVDEEDTRDSSWILYVDGASNAKVYRAQIILGKEGDIMVELSITFNFLVSNNQAKYEALIVGFQLIADIGITRLMICSDSQIVTSQVTEAYTEIFN